MKSKKILSLLLAVVMLFSVMSVSVFAAPVVYEASASYTLNTDVSVDPSTFSATLNIDYSKISSLDGGNADVTEAVTAKMVDVIATYTNIESETITANYVTDPVAFFAIFDLLKEDVAKVKEHNANIQDGEEKLPDPTPVLLTINSEIIVSDPKVFGVLEYTIDVVGFSEPLTIGLGPVDDALSSVLLPVNFSVAGDVPEFPAIASMEIISKPTKKDYTDTECFDPSGLVLAITTTTGESTTLTYSEKNDYMFSFTPSNKEKLAYGDSLVAIDFNGEQICKVPINVEHKFSSGYVSITTDKYSENKPGYHAIVCEGCGETHDAQPHWVEDPEAWTPNNDQTFFANGTESNYCADCGTKLVRVDHGSADYNVEFADYHFFRVILDYINMLLSIIQGSRG